jgi:hypothetical protein
MLTSLCLPFRLAGKAGAETNKRQTEEFKLWAAEQLEENGLDEDEAIIELEALLRDAERRAAGEDESSDAGVAAKEDVQYYTMLRTGMIQDHKRLGKKCRDGGLDCTRLQRGDHSRAVPGG